MPRPRRSRRFNEPNRRPSSPAAHTGDAGYAVAMLPEGEQAGPSARFSTGLFVEMKQVAQATLLVMALPKPGLESGLHA